MPAPIPQQLKEVAESVEAGGAPRTTVRLLLAWFYAQRRGIWVTIRIGSALHELELETVPDFRFTWLDGEIIFRKAEAKTVAGPAPVAPLPLQDKTPPSDPTYRIGKLDAANRAPVSVPPDSPLSRAVTLMITDDFSQLPLMANERTVKGMVTWASIGQALALGRPVNIISDCAVAHHEISADVSLFEAINGIVRHGYALVRAADQTIAGIVTTTDLGLQFGKLGEPFLLIGEIENYLRRIIGRRFTLDDLKAAKDPDDAERDIAVVEDLTFGEYVRLLEAPANWATLAVKVDRDIFVKGLHEIRRIRNDVMHFDPDGPSSEDLAVLRRWVALFQRLSTMEII